MMVCLESAHPIPICAVVGGTALCQSEAQVMDIKAREPGWAFRPTLRRPLTVDWLTSSLQE